MLGMNSLVMVALAQLMIDAGEGAVASTVPSGPAVNLLAGVAPKADRAQNAERMNDGKATDPGDNWQSVLTSVIEKEGSVTWDLGTPRTFEGAWIQADNNDVYVVQTSDDGTNFTTAWESSTVDNAGMQIRTASTLHGRGRFIKLSGKGGDGMFSVAELGIFATGGEAKAFVPSYQRNPANPAPQPFDGNWVVIALVLAGIVFLVRRMKPADEKTEAAPAAPEKKDEPAAPKG
ncbi:MAG: hypothetical protein IPJ65_17935 [Archangiaceae bacterium]|nr:hypothetical protein [Archangiaceae bacterium]